MDEQNTAYSTLWGQDGSVRSMPSLLVAYHPNPLHIGTVIPLVEPLELGRGSNVLGKGFLDDKRLSRKHAVVVGKGDEVSCVDLGSTNGTFIDGVRISEAILSNGSMLRVGNLMLVRRDLEEHFLPPKSPRFVGIGPGIARVLRSISAVAPERMAVLVRGETGVGKELVAQELHAASGRRGRLVPVNCAGIADGVLHTELFGHKRGAFTGAGEAKDGLVLQAENGTLFLDEIGDATPAFQKSLLRFLQEGTVRAVGGKTERAIDVRVVAATHVDLDRAVAEGTFRADLLARLDRWSISVPPLRDRVEDLPSLSRSIVGPDAILPVGLVERLMTHPWPGNIRELHSLLRWYELRCKAGEGTEAEVEERLEAALRRTAPEAPDPGAPSAERPNRSELITIFHAERGRMTAVARSFGVSRATIYRWFETANLDPSQLRAPDGGDDDSTG